MQNDSLTVQAAQQSFILVAEGGANIVLKYVGVGALCRKVIRIRKRAHSAKGSDDEQDASVAFQAQVVTAELLPAQFCAPLTSLEVSKAFLEALAQHIEPFRLPERRAKDAIDTDRRFVVMTDDLTGTFGHGAVEGPVVAVEIKPKWGFLPNSAYLSTRSRGVKTRFCRFCMHQHYRVVHEGGSSTSYCPLDLYSGDAKRIALALDALYDAWKDSRGSSNQLRIFIDGTQLSSSEHAKGEQALAKLTRSGAQGQSALARALGSVLHGSDVLHRLQWLQRTLDGLDIDGVQALGSHESLRDAVATLDTVSLEKQAKVARRILDGGAMDSFSEAAIAYALSSTVKDCSLMIRLMLRGGQVEHDLKVIDLDPKALSKLPHWAALDEKIWQCAAEGLDKTPCVDANRLSRRSAAVFGSLSPESLQAE